MDLSENSQYIIFRMAKKQNFSLHILAQNFLLFLIIINWETIITIKNIASFHSALAILIAFNVNIFFFFKMAHCFFGAQNTLNFN